MEPLFFMVQSGSFLQYDRPKDRSAPKARSDIGCLGLSCTTCRLGAESDEIRMGLGWLLAFRSTRAVG